MKCHVPPPTLHHSPIQIVRTPVYACYVEYQLTDRLSNPHSLADENQLSVMRATEAH